MITILSSASARPNFVKLAAVHHALAKCEGVKHMIVHTGQHYDPLLSDIFFKQLQIPEPDENLGVKGGANREETIALTAEAMKPVLKLARPDIVLVYGDVNGAVGAARAAADVGIRIGHVEAGLRSFDSDMPEELNRIEIDKLADELFVSEQSGLDHLKKEGAKGRVSFVGNTMIDTLIRMRPSIDASRLPFDLPERYAVATLHRPSNVDSKEALERNIAFLSEVSEKCPLILPLHRRTQAALTAHGLKLGDRIQSIEPLGYLEFLRLVSPAEFILTDSGGIQEEAAFLQKRCFTLRRNTERPATVRSGSNMLIDPDQSSDREIVLAFAAHASSVTVKIPEKWDGKAGERIAEVLCA
ncbi:MAG: UDP-N-acetylglucosamine 2-epimerase (non-hydrolyzing) [Candidatus Peribacteraceae bacterium]|nr:UDP-N-acetylglucosamine 2-epimerase (non-hydrolyzing) [Candidatus Peribacteraceae bacterium]